MVEKTRSGSSRRATLLLTLGLALAFVVAIVFRYQARRQAEADRGSSATPVVFLLSQQHGAQLTVEDRQALGAYLQKESGLVVDVRVAPSSFDGIAGFADTADVGLLGLFEYLLARAEYAVDAQLQVLRENGAATYTGEILVPSESPVKSVKDLQGKRFAYVDAFSTSGFVFPAKLLADASVRVTPEFAGSPGEVLARLKDGRVDAGAVYSGANTDTAALRVVATTDAIPNEPVFFRRGLVPEKREKLRAALEKLGSTPEGRTILHRIANITGFQRIDDAHYEPVLATVRAAGKTIYEVVPEGTRVESERRGIELVP